MRALPSETAPAPVAGDEEPAAGPDRVPPVPARLLIHFAGGRRLSAVEHAMQRLAGLVRGRTRSRPRRSIKLTVQDLQGRCIRSVESAGMLTRLRLPPGTYVILASNGRARRAYTLALSAGGSFDLYLDPLSA